MKTCHTCQKNETDRGMDCPRCATVRTLWQHVLCVCYPADLADLIETLGAGTIGHLRHERKGAWVLQSILSMIERISTARGFQPDSIRISVIAALNGQQRAEAMAADFDRLNGEGSYRRAWSKKLGHEIAEAFAEIKARMPKNKTLV